jgi:hypothetical protein
MTKFLGSAPTRAEHEVVVSEASGYGSTKIFEVAYHVRKGRVHDTDINHLDGCLVGP